MIALENFSNHIQTLKPNDWDRLFALLPKIESTQQFGEIKGGEIIGDGSITMPYWSSSEIVDDFINEFYGLNLAVVFDWGNWDEGKSFLSKQDFDYSTLDTLTLCMLLTTIVRADRFNEGFLVSCFEKGVVTKIIKALQRNNNKK